MQKTRAGITPAQRERLIMGLLMEQITDKINLALKARKATLTIDYTDVIPKLYIEMPGSPREGWMTLNVRNQACFGSLPQDPSLRAIVQNITETLESQHTYLRLAAEKRPGKKVECKLQVFARDVRQIALTLMSAYRGQVERSSQLELPKSFR